MATPRRSRLPQPRPPKSPRPLPRRSPESADLPPRQFVLGADTWRIDTGAGGWAEAGYLRAGHGDDYATTDLYTRVIYLNRAHPQGLARRTLWHELVHVLIHHAQWDAARIVDDEVEESIAHALEGPLDELMRRNRALAGWLAG